jgi:hypothetical protein
VLSKRGVTSLFRSLPPHLPCPWSTSPNGNDYPPLGPENMGVTSLSSHTCMRSLSLHKRPSQRELCYLTGHRWLPMIDDGPVHNPPCSSSRMGMPIGEVISRHFESEIPSISLEYCQASELSPLPSLVLLVLASDSQRRGSRRILPSGLRGQLNTGAIHLCPSATS